MRSLLGMTFLFGASIMGCDRTLPPITLRWESAFVHPEGARLRVEIIHLKKAVGFQRSPSFAGPENPVTIECMALEGEKKGTRMTVMIPEMEVPKSLSVGSHATLLMAKDADVCIGIQAIAP